MNSIMDTRPFLAMPDDAEFASEDPDVRPRIVLQGYNHDDDNGCSCVWLNILKKSVLPPLPFIGTYRKSFEDRVA